MTKISITHISNEHSDWQRALKFYEDELGILVNRLTEIAKKNTGDEANRHIEQFENKFKIQRENIDQLLHDIHHNIAALSKQQQDSQMQYVTKDLVQQHTALKELFVTQEATINNLRRAFNRFASIWM